MLSTKLTMVSRSMGIWFLNIFRSPLIISASQSLELTHRNQLPSTVLMQEIWEKEKKHVKLNVRHVGLKRFLTPYLKDKPVESEFMSLITIEAYCKHSPATNKKLVLAGVVCHRNLLDSQKYSSHSGIIYYGRISNVRTGRPDHGWSSQFDNEIGLSQEFLLKNHLLQFVHTI